MLNREKLEDLVAGLSSDEEGHAVAWGGGSLLTILLIVLILILIF